jgi:hypothetical protein
MSWGFFCDLEVTLPTATFKQIWKTKLSDHALPTPLLGFKNKELERTFTIDTSHDDADQPDVPLKDVPELYKWQHGRTETSESNGETTFRGCMCLDRGGDPSIARVVAALLYAARPTGRGHLVLVNDGSYSGENGVLLQLANGEVTRTLIADDRPLTAHLGPALWEGATLPTADEVVALATGAKASRKSAAAKRATKPAAKKSPAVKKAGSKKTPTKKATTKKATAKTR